MRPRDIRHLAVACDGAVIASDGGARLDRLDGCWFGRWTELPHIAAVAGLTALPNGELLASDSANNCVWRIDRAGTASGFAGVPQPPAVDRRPRRLDGPAETALFRSPGAIIAHGGGVTVAETGDGRTVLRFIATGQVSSAELGGHLVPRLTALASSNGNLYATCSDAGFPIIIHVVCAEGRWNASVHAGNPSESGGADGAGDAARFARPGAITVRPGGGLYVADGARLRVVSHDGVVRTISGAAPGFVDGKAPSARFQAIHALAGSVDGSLYIADPENDALRQLIVESEVTTPVAGIRDRLLTEPESDALARHFAAALLDDDAAEGWSIARLFVADHRARRATWPDRLVQPVSVVSARVGKELAALWNGSPDQDRARLGSFCRWLILCEQRGGTVDEVRDARLRRMWDELAAAI